EAITAFERVLALQPDNLPVRTELARAYAQLGDPAAAKRELDLVTTNPATPANVKHNLSSYASVLEESLRGGPRTFHTTITAGTGYDTNINTATASSYLVVPALSALGPARIEDGTRAQSSGFTQLTATGTVRQPLSPATALFASLSADAKTPFETSDYAHTTLTAEAGTQFFRPEGDIFTLGASAQQFWFGGDDYSTTYALNGSWHNPLSASTSLTPYLSVSHINYETGLPDAHRIILGSSLTHRLPTSMPTTLIAGLYGGHEESEGTAADHLSHNIYGGQFGIEIFPTDNLALFTEARLEHRAYSAPYPLFFTERSDTQLDLSTGLTYALTKGLSLRPSISYRHASSNVGFFNYSRWLTQLNLRYTL
ncbi:MAG: DUF560 domain-containing protein, partial [Verrucomicrobiaceae bacterium]